MKKKSGLKSIVYMGKAVGNRTLSSKIKHICKLAVHQTLGAKPYALCQMNWFMLGECLHHMLKML